MIRLSDFSAVIFDLDGLVLDTERTYRIAWKKAGKDLGRELPEALLMEMTGLPGKEILVRIKNHCGPNFDTDEFNRLSAGHWRDHVAEFGIDVKPGVRELLKFFADRRIPYALATNSHSRNATENLRLAGLKSAFSLQSTREQVPHGKPAPDLFLHAAEQLHTPIRHCLVLEDSAIGIEGAIKAGAIPVLIACEALAGCPSERFRCCRYGDLPELLLELGCSSA